MGRLQRAPTASTRSSPERRRLVAYFALTFALSWGYWIPDALTGGHWSHFPGLAGPMVAAVIVTAASGGRAALVALASHALRWRVPGRWYLASVGLVAIGALAVAVRAIVRSELPSVHALGRMPGLPDVGWFGVFVLTFLVNGYGEETGWRGFAWPALRERHTIAAAALVLAVPWAIWHLPTFWIDSGMRGFPPLMLPGFFAGMAAGAVVLGRLYERANSSLPVVALFHTVLNMASATKGTEGFPAVAVTAAVMVAAIAILRREARQLPR